MPVIDFTVCENVLSCREVGRVDSEDARTFAGVVAEAAEGSPYPIVVFIDARETEFISPDAANVFVQSAEVTDNVACYVVTTQDLIIKQTSRILGMRNRRGNTHIFDNYEEAIDFAWEQAQGTAAVHQR
ncbi:MAG: hypothetical protein AAFV33_21820 [Chloroflexota bacterium]